MENLLFNNWESIARILIIAFLAYVVLIFLLRSSGKRTLSKMNAFDFIVTIALGSTLATVILNKDISLADGSVAFFALIFLQFAITWLSVRSGKFKRLITSEPVLVLYKGELQKKVIKQERITIEEIHLAVRQKGIADLKAIDIMILETTGEFTVIPKIETSETESINEVKNYPAEEKD
ncbi:DUF421 domain-containing protein [Marivirga sp. S37H4]|uniref:DUF421 domain-containing protein n=1 Tax=Marivirga aurantiaca TaxID=2802615 RepID=A0A934WVY7_9BACT|nr:YetF domain-containing protein [Marivirga aurantiaca]MBK6263911.1 DUF421 domain-containing protein [Marivirga aurantiaca]